MAGSQLEGKKMQLCNLILKNYNYGKIKKNTLIVIQIEISIKHYNREDGHSAG